ncbi:MAG: FHA domain-containing protein [Planctomycetes bacterium]|nr:FHA domain-containing protein [Planctomycetota bacterium]
MRTSPEPTPAQFSTQYASLEEVRGAHPKRRHPVIAAEFTIGRGEECTLRVPDERASRRHALIRRKPIGYELRDLDSRNGTLLNEHPLTEPTRLQPGDMIQIGSHVFCFQDPRRAPVQEPAQEVEPPTKAPPPPRPVAPANDGPSLRIGTSLANPSPSAEDKPDPRLRTVLSLLTQLANCEEENALLHAVLDGLFQLFPQLTHAVAAIRDEGTNALEVRCARNATGFEPILKKVLEVDPKSLQGPAHGGLTRDVVRVSFEDIHSVADETPMVQARIPLIDSKKNLLGMLQLETPSDGKLSRGELELLSSLAPNLANAWRTCRNLERVRALEQETRERDDLKRLLASFAPKRAPDVAGYDLHLHEATVTIDGGFFEILHRKGERLLTMMGRVHGTGLVATTLAARLGSEVRHVFTRCAEPASGMTLMNRLACDGSKVMTSLLVLDLDLRTHELRIVNAGHTAPWLKRNAEVAVLQHGDAAPPLGRDASHTFQAHSWILSPEDVIVVFDESLPAVTNADGRTVGTEGLRLALSVARGSAGEIAGALLGAVRAFSGGTSVGHGPGPLFVRRVS